MPETSEVLPGPAHQDFWRADPSGHLFLLRGFQEDELETAEPGTLFDVTFPIWRTAEVLLHAESLARHLSSRPDAVTIHFATHYSGLKERRLVSWKGVEFHAPDHSVALDDEVAIEAEIPVLALVERVAGLLHGMLPAVYRPFGYELEHELVESEVALLLQSKSGRKRRPGR